MMNAKECRAKAAEALARAAAATDPDIRAIYNGHVREWSALSLTADVQDKLEIDLTERKGLKGNFRAFQGCAKLFKYQKLLNIKFQRFSCFFTEFCHWRPTRPQKMLVW